MSLRVSEARVTIRRSGWEMTEGRAVNPLLISCSVTAVVSYVALVYLVTMERLEDPGLWTLEAVERLYDFANLLSDPPIHQGLRTPIGLPA